MPNRPLEILHQRPLPAPVDKAGRATQRGESFAQIGGNFPRPQGGTQFHPGAALQGRVPLNQIHDQSSELLRSKLLEVGMVQGLLGHGEVPGFVVAGSADNVAQVLQRQARMAGFRAPPEVTQCVNRRRSLTPSDNSIVI